MACSASTLVGSPTGQDASASATPAGRARTRRESVARSQQPPAGEPCRYYSLPRPTGPNGSVAGELDGKGGVGDALPGTAGMGAGRNAAGTRRESVVLSQSSRQLVMRRHALGTAFTTRLHAPGCGAALVITGYVRHARAGRRRRVRCCPGAAEADS